MQATKAATSSNPDETRLQVQEGSKTGDKTWTDHAVNTAKRLLDVSEGRDDDADEWEDLTPGHVATIDLKVTSDKGNAGATQGTKPDDTIPEGSNSLLGMIEKLSFEPSAGTKAEQDSTTSPKQSFESSEHDVPSSGFRSLEESGYQCTVPEDDAKFNTSRSESEKTSGKEFKGLITEDVDSSIRVVQDQFEKAKEKGIEAFAKAYETVKEESKAQSDEISQSEEAKARAENTVTAAATDKVKGGVRAAQERLEETKGNAENAYETAKDYVKESIVPEGEAEAGRGSDQCRRNVAAGEGDSPFRKKEGNENDNEGIARGTLYKVDTGKHTIENELEKVKDKSSGALEGSNEYGKDVAEQQNDLEPGNMLEEQRTSETSGGDKDETLADRAMCKVDTGIHTVKHQLGQAASTANDDTDKPSADELESDPRKGDLKADSGDFKSKADLMEEESQGPEVASKPRDEFNEDDKALVCPGLAFANGSDTLPAAEKEEKDEASPEQREEAGDVALDEDNNDPMPNVLSEGHAGNDPATGKKKKKKRRRRKKNTSSTSISFLPFPAP